MISGNGFVGVDVRSKIAGFATQADQDGDGGDGTLAGGNLIVGNFVGTNASGGSTVPNGSTISTGTVGAGIYVNKASNTTIGGSRADGAGNVVSNNQASGVEILGDPKGNTPNGAGTLVQGNIIGLDPTGMMALANLADGVYVVNAPGATIGGVGSPFVIGNVISGNGADGIHLFDSGTVGTRIGSNFLGTDILGKTKTGVGNCAYGILIDDGVKDAKVLNGSQRNFGNGFGPVRDTRLDSSAEHVPAGARLGGGMVCTPGQTMKAKARLLHHFKTAKTAKG